MMDLKAGTGSVLLAWVILSVVFGIAVGEGTGVKDESSGSHTSGAETIVWKRCRQNFTMNPDVVKACSSILNNSPASIGSTRKRNVGSCPSIHDFGTGRWSSESQSQQGVESKLIPGNGGQALLEIDDVTADPVRPSILAYRMKIVMSDSKRFSMSNFSFLPADVVGISAEGLFSMQTGEFCMAASVDKPWTDVADEQGSEPGGNDSANDGTVSDRPADQPDDDRKVTLSLKIEHAGLGSNHNMSHIYGDIKSVYSEGDSRSFEPVYVDFKVMPSFEEIFMLNVAGWVQSSLLVLELLCIIWQLFYMHMRPDRAPWMSIFMVLLIVVVGVYRMAGSLYEGTVPWRDFLAGAWPECTSGLYCQWSRCSGPHCAPFLVTTAISAFLALTVVSLNAVMLIVLWRSRLNLYHSALKSHPLPIEKPVLFLCVPFYVVGVVLSALYGHIASFLILVKLHFLIPQAVSNALWDSTERALHPIYSVGVTFALAAEMVFTFYRDLNSLGEVSTATVVWLLGNPSVMLVFLILVHSQQSSWGGRWFIPHGWLPARREKSSLQEEEIALVENPGQRSDGGV
ncbi:hypothetical protein CBR_g11067 [Chara braunii]|uniref:RING-type E3 ubiquitin transferase n=1 Tax=Chara braunii TaxID=69332 RepID=A0A388KPZ8_CHABU|nr:hypothetical protein CBR_g11067 [Chara braunii]|eukprot:GBG72134.1 hypothetical protein CBR_g11067 [Chara braunii]